MSLVQLISGAECKISVVSMETLNLINGLLSPSVSRKEVYRLCCKAGICPVTLFRKIK
ncbi:hypothetical protein [Bdellovibrio sp. HCB274]|uniref:hypothetical protein n=1 Tax=Bdellovibrio sp. HCB274 TaxID=3394361 RepID=UPI0039B46037